MPEEKKHVFISHSAQDDRAGRRVLAVFEAAGIRCWYSSRPGDVEPGSEWEDSIVAALDKSYAVVLLFSKAANESPWVKRELSMAARRRLPIYPVRMENVDPVGGLEPYLTSVQWTNAFSISGLNVSLLPVLNKLTAHPAAIPHPTPQPDVLHEHQLITDLLEPYIKAIEDQPDEPKLSLFGRYRAWKRSLHPLLSLVVQLLETFTFVLGVFITVLVIFQAKLFPKRTVEPDPPTFSRSIKVCQGDNVAGCSAHDVYVGCGDPDAWVRQVCTKFSATKDVRPGGMCGYTIYTYTCTPKLSN